MLYNYDLHDKDCITLVKNVGDTPDDMVYFCRP